MIDYIKLEKELHAAVDTIWDVCGHIWEFAELGFEEVQSSALATKALETVGFKVSEGR
jgi:metal-dependent amidase/aminoacylase/carboxypeptidase family protein